MRDLKVENISGSGGSDAAWQNDLWKDPCKAYSPPDLQERALLATYPAPALAARMCSTNLPTSHPPSFAWWHSAARRRALAVRAASRRAPWFAARTTGLPWPLSPCEKNGSRSETVLWRISSQIRQPANCRQRPSFRSALKRPNSETKTDHRMHDHRSR